MPCTTVWPAPIAAAFGMGKYERAYLAKHENVFVPFRQNRPPLKMSSVFVPLKVHAKSVTEPGNTARTPPPTGRKRPSMSSTRSRRTGVGGIGAPGSGKTMLLRHIALAYADCTEDYLPDEPIPVLLELHRLARDDKPPRTATGRGIRTKRLPPAEKFVAQALERGTLMLLFDGLDEVDSQGRRVVVQRVRGSPGHGTRSVG